MTDEVRNSETGEAFRPQDFRKTRLVRTGNAPLNIAQAKAVRLMRRATCGRKWVQAGGADRVEEDRLIQRAREMGRL